MERKPKVLVIDGERTFREMARKALQPSFEVSCTSDPNEGLEKAKKDSPNLILLGYLEPRGTSFELHNKLREGQLTRNIPLVVVDVPPQQHSRKGWRREEGMQMDADDYLSRPLEPAELKEAVDRIVRRVRTKPMDLKEVLEQMEIILNRIDKIEQLLVN